MANPRGPDKRPRLKLHKYSQPIYTNDEEKLLFSILYRLCDCNYTLMADRLFVTPSTIRGWNTNGFPNPWWGFTFRYLISRLLKHERARDGSKHKHKWSEAIRDLQRVPNLDKLLDDSEIVPPTDWTAAMTHVRTVLYNEKKFKLSWDFLRLPAYSGGYSEQVLRRALHDIGAMSKTKGFGSDKETIWYLPIDKDYKP